MAQAHGRLRLSSHGSHCCLLLRTRQQNPQPGSASRAATTAVTALAPLCLGWQPCGDTTALCCCLEPILPSQSTGSNTASLEKGENRGKTGKKTSSTARKFCQNADSLGFYPAIYNTALQPQNICLTTSSAHAAWCFSPRCTGQAQPLRASIQPCFCFPSAAPRSQITVPPVGWAAVNSLSLPGESLWPPVQNCS